jgi:hypothetical protein
MEINDIVKTVIKPTLAEAGFKSKGSGFVKEIEDGFLVIFLKKGRYNTKDFASWNLNFYTVTTDYANECKEKKMSFIGANYSSMNIRALLPYQGFFMDIVGMSYYYDIHLDKNAFSVEELADKIMDLLKEYVIPFTNQIEKLDDYENAVERLKDSKRPREEEILRFFLLCLRFAVPRKANIQSSIQTFHQMGFTKEIIEENWDLLERIINTSRKDGSTVTQYVKIIMNCDDKEAFCKEVKVFVEQNKNHVDLDLHPVIDGEYEEYYMALM